MKNILVTGGTGYIGSHTVVELINAGYNPIIQSTGLTNQIWPKQHNIYLKSNYYWLALIQKLASDVQPYNKNSTHTFKE